MDRPIVFLDTENAAAHGAPHLCEVAGVRVAGGEVVDHFAELVRPEVPLDPEVIDVTGLDERDLADAAPAGEVLGRFFGWIGDDWMAAHRAEVDAAVLGFEAARHGLAVPGGPLIDTLALARALIPEAPDHKLATLVDHLELDVDGRHRALPDAVACWKVFEECVARLEPGAGPAELLTRAGRPVTIASAGPRTPRLAPRLRALEAACRSGDAVRLCYGDASLGEAPAWLAVRPRVLFELGRKAYLEAECQRSGTLKTYRLDRVQRVSR
jgi:DNA polymerase III epsilon subunit-like protein